MKRIILLLAMAGLGLAAYSQKVYFIYLQTEPVQPFFVKLNGKLHSSSASGYLILSRLVDSTYTFSIGFNRPGLPEQPFSVKVSQQDHGFLVKDFGDKGWGIVDLQTLNIQYAATASTTGAATPKDPGKEVSPFTDLLSKATGDPSLRESPPAPKAEAKPDVKPDVVAIEQPKSIPPAVIPLSVPETATAIPARETAPVVMEKKEEAPPAKIEAIPVKAEPLVTPKEEKKIEPTPVVTEPVAKPPVVVDTISKIPVVIEEKKEPLNTEPVQEKAKVSELPAAKAEPVTPVVYAKSVVTKRSESSTTEGFGLVFIDTWEGGKSDTIRLLIPNPKLVAELVKETPKADKKFLDIQATAVKPAEKKVLIEEKPKQPEQPQPLAEVKTEPKPAETPVEKPISSGGCAETASETDFFALRKSMAAAEGDDEMISLAKKYFKLKCFTAAQLKNLSALFLNDEAKYNFFDAAYKYTSDKSAFASLETELKDPYYINRFKAILGK